MDPSRPQHHQDMASHQTLESMLVCTKAAQADKKPRPAEQALKCPRCDSSNTKFCYYNNYSLTQPRYFCKSCRRYWTKGGTLRNVPVGGGCRKIKRSSSSNSSSSSKIRTQDQQHPLISTANHNNPLLSYDPADLSLAFARLQNGQLGFDHQHHENDHFSLLGNPNTTHGLLDAFRSGFLETPINGFQNLYYGNNVVGNGVDHMGNVENVRGRSVNVSEEMGNLPYEDLMSGSSGATTTAGTVTTVKQEGCNGGIREAAAAESGRVLWGYPCQIGGGDGGSIMGDVDAAGRHSSWINGLGSSNWHGLLNSPLM